MKTPVLLLVTLLATSISAYSEAGAYERLWYWYAYTLDTSGSKIAPGCAKVAGSQGRCTFVQFMNYIDQQSDKKTKKVTLIPREIQNVNPNDVEKTVKALSAGHYTGTYFANLIHPSVNGKDRVDKLMSAVTGFLEGKVGDADKQLRDNLQKVTGAVARLRQGLLIDGLKEDLQTKYGITLKTKMASPIEGSDIKYDSLDVTQTATANGITEDRVEEIVAELENGNLGHVNNVRRAQEGAASVSWACT